MAVDSNGVENAFRLAKILKQPSGASTRLAKKRRKAGWNDNYRAKRVFGKDFLCGGPGIIIKRLES